MKSHAKCYEPLRDYLETVPLVDCHDHTEKCTNQYADPISVVVGGYFHSDILSASSDKDDAFIQNTQLSVEQRWPVLERAWRRTCHTGYAQVTKRVLKKFYGESELTLDALKRMEKKLLNLEDEKLCDDILGQAKIAVRLQNYYPDLRRIFDKTAKLSPRGRLVIPLPLYHAVRSYQLVHDLVAPLDRQVTSLDEYLAACRDTFEAYKAFGAVAFKDQSAYQRTLRYDNPSRGQAEEIFNWFMADPRRSASYPDGIKPLDDYLFHEFMRMARDLDLPVQIHTGHMAGIRSEITKTNAAGLTSVIELHRDVRFDLFHANWPYSSDIIFLAKNYPNVTIDFCWANIIDPIYCQAMFKQVLSSVPHGKIHGYGSDFKGFADRAWAHAGIARDNVAISLAEMVDMSYLDLDEAKEVGRAWLFDNANEFFRLGL